MDEDEYIELRVINPVAKVPASDIAHSAKALSTIQEHASAKAFHYSPQNGAQRDAGNSKKLESNYECSPPSAQRVDSFRSLNQSFDIDLLLRYYACNADMEKSINKVLTKKGEKCFSYSNDPLVDQGWKDRDQGPLIELRALYKIFDSLKRPSSEDTLLSAFRFRSAMTKLQSLVARCTDEQLEQVLSADPSMKMCKHCGVISCSNSRNVSIQPRKSPPRTSYFLNTQVFPSNDNNNSKLHREMERCGKKQATPRTGKCWDTPKNAKQFTYARCTDNKRDCGSRGVNLNSGRQDKLGAGVPRRVDTMVAERENDNVTHGMCSIRRPAEINFEDNKIETRDGIKSFAMELQGSATGTQMTELSPVKEEKLKIESTDKIINNSGTTRQVKRNSNFEVRDKSDSSATGNSSGEADDLMRRKQNEQVLQESQQSGSECNEKVVKNILYVKSKSQVDDFAKQGCAALGSVRGARSKQNQLLNYPTTNNIDSIINLMTYLAHGGLKSADRKKKEFVSQLDERTRVPSRRSNNKSSFVLHASRDDHPQLDSAFKVCNKLKYSNEATNNKHKAQKLRFRNYHKSSDHWEYIESAENNKGSNSVTCLMEDDSLENCTEASDSVLQSDPSYTTNCSSSSAEHMIREWVKPPQTDKESSAYDKTCEEQVAQKSSTVGLNVKHPSSGAAKDCPHCSEASVGRQRGLQTDSRNSKCHSELPTSQTDNDFPGSTLRSSQEPADKCVNKINSKKAEAFGARKLFSKQLFGPLKSIKSIRPTKSEGHKHSSGNLLDDHLKNITRRITYSGSSFGPVLGDDGRCGEVANILLLYREILQQTEGMDWESFREFIGNLHPSQKDLWCDVYKAVSNEAKRIADKGNVVTEVCIEISAVPCKGTKNEGGTCSNKIVFEMDMALRDVERFLDWKLASTEKAQLDTLQRDSRVIEVENDDVCGTEVVSKQAD
ncbi:uncharacterized protein LOC143373920 [Andrena cerasifolii]|uniref:uncharacterized protein LOC143373920 n=1 Tax=Andrena cerasifolii TaxID=2819439 RepID=UPI00403836C8